MGQGTTTYITGLVIRIAHVEALVSLGSIREVRVSKLKLNAIVLFYFSFAHQ